MGREGKREGSERSPGDEEKWGRGTARVLEVQTRCCFVTGLVHNVSPSNEVPDEFRSSW